MTDTLYSGELEVRETAGREPTLVGVMLVEGRAASQRKELFTLGSVEWPSNGIAIRTEHLAAEETRAQVFRGKDGTLTVKARATEGIRKAVAAGKSYLSVEFQSLRESKTRGGIREIQSAIVSGAALVSTPEYTQTYAELRSVQDIRAISEKAAAWLR